MHPQAICFEHRLILGMITAEASVLDLGCGTGELLELLIREKQVRGQGIEIDEQAIYSCVAKGLSVFHGDIDSGLSEYRNQSFDYVILNQSLQQVQHLDVPGRHHTFPLGFEAAKKIPHGVSVERDGDLLADFSKETLALCLDTAQTELQERRQVMPGLPCGIQRVQIAHLVLIVVIRHGDEERVTQAGTLEHDRLQRAGRAAIAVEKRMDRREVIVQRERLDERVLIPKGRLRGPHQPAHGGGAFLTAFGPAMSRRPEGHVLVPLAHLPGRAVVVITARHHAAVHIHDHALIHRSIVLQGGDPAVTRHRAGGLSLGASLQLFRRLPDCRVEFLVGEFRPFDA